MIQKIKLSELVAYIEDALEDRFEGETFWITTQIMDVKRQQALRRCYLKFIEKEHNDITTEIRGVFWANAYIQIENFEKATKQVFKDGIEVTCNVRVRFHPKYGLNLDVLQIDFAYVLGTLEIERQQTLERLLKENPKTIRLVDEQFITWNNSLPLPTLVQRIALITAPNSDGQRDFKQEIGQNPHGYAFSIEEFLTQIQGDNAHHLILQQLKLIEQEKEKFDVVVIIRGGGSQTDFKPFENYELAQSVAIFTVPVLTGIGHDRNTSIVDLMARQHKTPTKVAAFIVDHNMKFENAVEELKERFFLAVESLIENAKSNLQEMKRVVKSSSPTTILNRGFAILAINNEIVTDPEKIKANAELQALLKNEIIYSTVIKKTKDGKRFNL